MFNFSKKQFLILGFFTAAVFFGITDQVEAAIFRISPQAKNFGIGEEFYIDVKINTEDSSVNAAQTIVGFSSDLVKFVSAEKSNSIFNFWLEEPVVLEGGSGVKFIGGTQKGISGSALQVLRLKFKTLRVGQAKFGFSDAAITASDGKGTNVLTTTEESTVTIGTKVVDTSTASVSGEVIEKVTRVPVQSLVLPEKPRVRVPLYPDETKWYNIFGDVVAFWDLPNDVIQVYTKLSQNKDTSVGTKETELFNGKNFGVIPKEGIWYIRVQYKNNRGLSDLAYYQINIDTTTPLPFEISADRETSDNPAPEISYGTSDSLSGIRDYSIYIDGADPIKTTSTVIKLPVLKPGKHKILVKSFDMAGNSIEDDLNLEILPLDTPTVDFVSKSISQDDSIFASGRATPNGFVDLIVYKDDGREVATESFSVDPEGVWSANLDKNLPSGNYHLIFSSRDERGAVSLPTEKFGIKVRPKTILSLGFIDLGWFEIFLFVVLIIAVGISGFGWYLLEKKKTRYAYSVVAARDLDKLCDIIFKDIENLSDFSKEEKKLSPHIKSEIDYFLKKSKENLSKMKKYLGDELGKIK